MADIRSQYKTEKECRNQIAAIRWRNGYMCPLCGFKEAWVTAEGKYKCKKCGHKQSVTAGTLFEGSHVPLSVWFEVMSLYVSDNSVTAKRIQEKYAIGSSRTAQRMMQLIKLAQAKQSFVDAKLGKLSGLVEIGVAAQRTFGKKINLLVAVQIENRTVTKIRARIIDSTDTDRLNIAVRSIVHEKSEIRSSDLLRCFDLFRRDYKRAKLLTTYTFPYFNREKNRLLSAISDKPKEENLEDFLIYYCMKRNHPPKQKTFEELLEAMVLTSKEL